MLKPFIEKNVPVGFLASVLLALHLSVIISSVSSAQTRNWVSSVSGDYSDPARWSSNQVPDSTSEIAEFDVFGIYTVNFPQTVGSSIDQLKITRGDIRFFSSTFGDETLTANNGIEITNAELDLDRKTSFGNVNLASNGVLTMSEAAQLRVLQQSSIDVAGIDIEAGSNSQTTEILLSNNQTSHFGDVIIANRGSGSFEGAINLFNSTSATVGNIDIATTGIDGRRGFLQLSFGATITQSTGITNVGANSSFGEASLFISGSTFSGDEVNVSSNGRINLVSGHIDVATSLTVDGGLYEETDSTTRSLGTNATVLLSNNALATFTNEDLVLDSSQTFSIQDSTVNGDVTFDVISGNVDFSGTSLVELPVQIEATGSLIANANSTSTFTSSFVQEGMLEVSSGANFIFQEDFQANTILGTGTSTFEDTVLVGDISSPLSIAGDAEFESTSELEIRIGGTSPTLHDQLMVGNSLTQGGTLRVSLVDLGSGLFAPSIGDEFELLSATTILEDFGEVQLPLITSTQQWQLVQSTTEVILRLVDRGDYNGNGIIDAADYTVWRDSLGTSGHHLPADGNGDGTITVDDYNLWANAFDFPVSSIQNAHKEATSVPEPASLIFLITATCLLGSSYEYRLKKIRLLS